MGSKASGEPSLLLSVSILHAMRAAIKAARAELSDAVPSAALPRVTTPATSLAGESPLLARHRLCDMRSTEKTLQCHDLKLQGSQVVPCHKTEVWV